jgi:hypothetical protein
MSSEIEDKLRTEKDLLIFKITELYQEYDYKTKTLLKHGQDEKTLTLLEELYSDLNAKVSLLEKGFVKSLANYIAKKNNINE